MNWEAISAVSDMIGAAAIVVTLIYLAIQIRHAKQEMTRSGQQNRAEIGQQLMSSISDTPYLAPMFAKLGGWDWTDVGLDDPEDTIRFNAWMFAWWRTEELNFRTYSPEQLATQKHLIKALLSAWGTPWWPSNKAIFDTDFVDMVDAIYAQVLAEETPQASLQSNR